MIILLNELNTLSSPKTSKKPFSFINLFTGASGLTEVFYQKNYKVLFHTEFDKCIHSTLKERMRFCNYTKVEITRTKLTNIANKYVMQKLNFLNVKLYQKVGFRLICLI